MYNKAFSSIDRGSLLTLPQIFEKKFKNEKIVALTAYDASFAALLDSVGIDIILVGDSLGMVIQGHSTTLSVNVQDMVYHTAAVARGLRHAFLIADMPFMSYRNVDNALDTATQLIGQGEAAMVKLEGAGYVLDAIHDISQRGIPVCAHLGVTPQSVHKLGGYRVQGKEIAQAEQLIADALAIEQAGAQLLVLECIPAPLANAITHQLRIPTIGIGAGPHCDGQILVLYDVLGITPCKRPRFSKDFLYGRSSVKEAIHAYADAVRAGEFPTTEHSF